MAEDLEYAIKQKNQAYYDFMEKESLYNPKSIKEKHKRKEKHKKKSTTFAKQEIHLSDLSIVPKGYESIAYFLYALLIPYAMGYIFLYLALARVSFTNNPFLGTDNFLIVWMIGYEILSIIALIWIMKLYLTFDNEK
ncbi:MAG: hypothetical protein Q9M34_05425 [Sulfurimonas sp.]|nr:hypothetical protein [Sulfurimonas sp.]